MNNGLSLPRQTPATYYITTSIPYVNAKPHIGFALEAVLTDALARYHRQRGDDVRALTGTDDNSLKNVRAAETAGVETRALVDANAQAFQRLLPALNLSYDDFIRTSADPRHLAGVRKLWLACATNGDIYRRPYRGLYCVACESFYTEDELVDGLCPEHLTPPEIVEEENYFFRLSRYARQLEDLISSGALRITPETRKNEALSLIRGGLTDFSVSRSAARARGWGIPVPDDPDQIIYVWFDALGNYITALEYADDGPLFERYWRRGQQRVHVIGKDIVRFHAVYWPAILLSAGLALPTEIFAHGFFTIGGEKISKSRGNVVDPIGLAQEWGADALRYYLLHEIAPASDGDFTLERLRRAYNNDLADRLGNLLNRAVRMISRYYDGVVPERLATLPQDEQLLDVARSLPAGVERAMEAYEPNVALSTIWRLVDAANRYIEQTEPWALARQRRASGPDGAAAGARLATALYNVAEALRLIAYLCQPFLPETARGIARQLGIELRPEDDWSRATRWGEFRAGMRVAPDAVLFPKRDDAGD